MIIRRLKNLVLIIILLSLNACATIYEAERTDPKTGVITKIRVVSYREFKGGISIRYNRDSGEFDVQAGEVTTGRSPVEDAAAKLLLQIPSIILKGD